MKQSILYVHLLHLFQYFESKLFSASEHRPSVLAPWALLILWAVPLVPASFHPLKNEDLRTILKIKEQTLTFHGQKG